MAETDAPMFQSTRSMKREMDEILSEKQDPVSGNTAPIGATPAEVRDDIPIMASPNEFMIDAATRRYYGTPFFENLQAAAKQGFKRIKAGEESFFRDDELEVEEAAQKVSSGDSPQQMQDGGEVEGIEGREIPLPTGGGYGGYGGASTFTGYTFETYVHPTKPDIQIIFFQGRPLSPIPEGYVPKGMIMEEIKEDIPQITDRDPPRDPPPTWATTPLEKWTDKMWTNYGTRKGVGVDPLGKIIAGAAAVAFTGPGAIYSGPAFINKMDSESKKRAEAILKAAQGKLKTEKDAVKIKMYEDAIKKAKAEIALVDSKKPFSMSNLLKNMLGGDDDPEIIEDYTKRDPDRDPSYDPIYEGYEGTGGSVAPPVRPEPPQQTSNEEEEEDETSSSNPFNNPNLA